MPAGTGWKKGKKGSTGRGKGKKKNSKRKRKRREICLEKCFGSRKTKKHPD